MGRCTHSRHYADTAALALHPVASRALTREDFRKRVVAWKSKFFGSGWAHYVLAVSGTFSLVPPAERMRNLRQDYQAMRDRYLRPPRSFDEVLATLSEVVSRINRATVRISS